MPMKLPGLLKKRTQPTAEEPIQQAPPIIPADDELEGPDVDGEIYVPPPSVPPWMAGESDSSANDEANAIDQPLDSGLESESPPTLPAEPNSQAAPPISHPTPSAHSSPHNVGPGVQEDIIPGRTQDPQPERVGSAAVLNWNERYVMARQEWDERVSGHIKRERIWQKIAFANLVVAVVAIVGVIVVSDELEIVPHVVEVDREGTIVTSYGAHQLRGHLNASLTKGAIETWITSFRTVTADLTVQGNLLLQFEAYLDRDSPVYQSTVAEIRRNSPVIRSENELVYPEIDEMRQFGQDSWYVKWHERIVPRSGGVVRTENYSGTITIGQGPISEAKIRFNPLGVRITSFDYEKDVDP